MSADAGEDLIFPVSTSVSVEPDGDMPAVWRKGE
jgi:hypothetical protein